MTAVTSPLTAQPAGAPQPTPFARLAADADVLAALVRPAAWVGPRPPQRAGARVALVQCALAAVDGRPLGDALPGDAAAPLSAALCEPLVRAVYAGLPYAWLSEPAVFAHAAVRRRAGAPGTFDRYGSWGSAAAPERRASHLAQLGRQLGQDAVMTASVVVRPIGRAVLVDRVEVAQYAIDAGAPPSTGRLVVNAVFRPGASGDAPGFAQLAQALINRLAATVPPRTTPR